MRKLLFWLAGFPFAILLAIFAANNLDVIEVYLWPLPHAVGVPTFVLFLGALGIGLVAGAFLMWLSVLSLRVRVYNRDLEIKSLKRQMERAAVEHSKLLEKTSGETRALPSS